VIKKNDLLLIVAIVFISLAAFAFMFLSRKEGSKLIVYVGGKEHATFSLDEDVEYTVKQENGAYNTFIIKDGKVDMIAASCPDKLCVKDRSIHYSNDTIVCLPNNVVLQIVGGEEGDVDIIAK